MKITKETLIKIIKEEMEEYTPGPMTQMTQMDPSKPDPMDILFRIMDAVVDMALEIIKADRGGELDSEEAMKEMMPIANEVVTARLSETGRVDQMDEMAQELAMRYMEMMGKNQSHPGRI